MRPLPADLIQAESLLAGQEAGSATEEPSQEPIQEPVAAIPTPASVPGSGMLLESVGIEKAEKPEAAEEAKPAETQQVKATPYVDELLAAAHEQEAQPHGPSQVIKPLDLVASGLIMVETIPEKIKSAEPDLAEEQLLLQRRRKRTPPPPAMEKDEPLVQVETHK